MADDFDDFFDSPRPKTNLPISSKENSQAAYKQSYEFSGPQNYVDIPSTSAKPPAHPTSGRPTSGLNKRTVAQVEQPVDRETKTFIEAKLPDTYISDNEYGYSDEEFDDEELGGNSGRKAPAPPVTVSDSALRTKDLKRSERLTENSGCTRRKHLELTIASDEEQDSGDDSDVTDVSPLNSPVAAPHPHLGKMRSSNASKPSINSTNDFRTRHTEVNRHMVKSKLDSEVCQADSDAIDLDVLLKTVLDIETKSLSSTGSRQNAPTARPVSSQRRGSSRLNYSFSNDQLRAIERENQRLMKSIIKYAADAKKAKSRPVKTNNSPATKKRPSSAAINRAKQLQKIESENLMLLSRLQHTRPSRELQRDTLIGEFDRRTLGSSVGCSRPTSGVAAQRSSISAGVKHRPRSAAAGRRQPDDDFDSRPATVFACRPDDDDILTWDDGL